MTFEIDDNDIDYLLFIVIVTSIGAKELLFPAGRSKRR